MKFFNTFANYKPKNLLYHGSDADFSNFQHSTLLHGSEFGHGIYLTNNKNRAKQYGKNLYHVNIDLKNPLEFNKLVNPSLVTKLSKKALDDGANPYHVSSRKRKYFDEENIEKAYSLFEKEKEKYSQSGVNYDSYDPTVDEDDKGLFVEYSKPGRLPAYGEHLHSQLSRIYGQSINSALKDAGVDGVVMNQDTIAFHPNQLKIVKKESSKS